MRQIQVPFIADFEEVDLDTALELEGARFQVDQVNWPDSFPYAPLCAGRIARTEDALVVDFRVSGLDLRALNTEDNGSQWEDSCVEVFIEHPDGSEYYNFEINPIGKILAAKGPGRNGRIKRPADEMEEILRIARFEGFYKCGDKTAHPHFLSWNPVGTPAPDFHRPDFFGELILR